MAGASNSLQGKTVLITGAARGIGADTARRAAARGARLALVGLEPDELASVARDCGPDALWFEADVTDSDSLGNAIALTAERAGGIDAVVANAGIAAGGPIRYMPDETFRRVIEVNLLGVWNTVRLSLPHVIDSRGYLLQVASLAAIMPMSPGLAPYAASKAAVEAMSKALRVEVAHMGVDVGVAYFGWIDTDMVRGGQELESFNYLRSRLPPMLRHSLPLARAGEAMVDGIEKRAKVVAAPRIVRALSVLRGIVSSGTERQTMRSVPQLMALFEAERQRTGHSMADPVGPGGAADMRASGTKAETQAR